MGAYAGRYPAESVSDDISSLALILARVQRISGTTAVRMARGVGFMMGREFALRSDPHRFSGVHSELSYLFRRLNLGRVILNEWKPVLFVARPDLRIGSVEGAFGDGVLEGVMDVRLGRSVFVEHSILLSKGRGVDENVEHRSERGVKNA